MQNEDKPEGEPAEISEPVASNTTAKEVKPEPKPPPLKTTLKFRIGKGLKDTVLPKK